MKLGAVIGVVCIVAGVAGLGVMYSRSRTSDGRFAESPNDTTKIKVNKFAYEAFPPWRKANPGKCPTLDDLIGYLNGDDGADGWGRPVKLQCGGANDIVVISAGEDGREGTTDDIRSDKP